MCDSLNGRALSYAYVFLLAVSAALNEVLGTCRVDDWMGGMNASGEMAW